MCETHAESSHTSCHNVPYGWNYSKNKLFPLFAGPHFENHCLKRPQGGTAKLLNLWREIATKLAKDELLMESVQKLERSFVVCTVVLVEKIATNNALNINVSVQA